ncbi:MAG: (2Fe-2S) ferredoxin domain-containing protein [Peptococcaceae bacterium]|nr:(2Fe-2S) ferredoxin domain-containing protein [Peptococcaceae bacterium]
MLKPKYHILVCTSSRATGQQKGFCHTKGGVDLMQNFLLEVEERELGSEVMVSNTGCLGLCEQGPIVVVYPDNVWYGKVSVADISVIMDEHIENGQPVERLLLR